MTDTQQLYNEYARLRSTGQRAESILETLRDSIDALHPDDKKELVRMVRNWEVENRPWSGGAVKPIKPLKPQRPTAVTGGQVACPNCRRMNAANEIFCAGCGQFLQGSTSAFDTQKLKDTSLPTFNEGYFGEQSTLILVVRGASQSHKLTPQQHAHELVIGRSEGATVRVDLDLTPYRAAEAGVSRMHLSLRYDAKAHTIIAADAGSSNGTFINGQRLYPQEVRVLRHGDEVRLGSLVLNAYFHHPSN